MHPYKHIHSINTSNVHACKIVYTCMYGTWHERWKGRGGEGWSGVGGEQGEWVYTHMFV